MHGFDFAQYVFHLLSIFYFNWVHVKVSPKAYAQTIRLRVGIAQSHCQIQSNFFSLMIHQFKQVGDTTQLHVKILVHTYHSQTIFIHLGGCVRLSILHVKSRAIASKCQQQCKSFFFGYHHCPIISLVFFCCCCVVGTAHLIFFRHLNKCINCIMSLGFDLTSCPMY